MGTSTGRRVSRALAPPLLLAGALAGLSMAAGGMRVDMRDFHAPPVVGWSTEWEFDDATSSTSTVLSVAVVDGERSVNTRTEASDGSFLETELVTYGGVVHYGTITSVVAGGVGVVLPPREGRTTRLLPVVQRIGRTYRSRVIRGSVLDYQSGARTGRFVRRETATLGGFEDKITPGGSHVGALRQDWTADTRYLFTDGSELRVATTGTWWFAIGQGVVAQESRSLIYLDRILDADSGLVSGWRTSLTVPAGVLFDLAVYCPAR
jgi:hypothetical protein